MSRHLLLAQHAQTYELAAGVPLDVDLPINGAADWRFVVRNVGDTNAVTAMAVTRAVLGVDEQMDAAVAVTADIPLAAGARTAIVGTNEPLTTLR